MSKTNTDQLFKDEKEKTEFFRFVSNHLNDDVEKLLLTGKGQELGSLRKFAIDQIIARNKYANKLKNFFTYQNFLIPTLVACEQATHDAVAAINSSIVKPGEEWLDMTAGLGNDCLKMAKNGANVIACEIDPFKSLILKYNADILNIHNIEILFGNSIDFLKKTIIHFDGIFIDPARRDGHNGRLYNLHDCQPDILSVLPLIKDKTAKLAIKCSPMLDVSQTIRDLPECKEIKVVCVDGECKEILAVCYFNRSVVTGVKTSQTNARNRNISFQALDLDKSGDVNSDFSYTEIFDITDLKHSSLSLNLSNKYLSESHHILTELYNFSRVSTISHITENYTQKEDLRELYLYEPNAAIMKLSPWEEIHNRFDAMFKIGKSSHLFISNKLYADFPGRIMKIEKILSKKDRKTLKGFPANIVCRNYPLSPPELRKKLGVKEGKDKFIYATSFDSKETIMLLCSRYGK